MRRIAVVTGTRADYGLLRWVLEGICNAPDSELQLVVTGMHLSPEFGLTFREIEKDGFAISRRVETLLSSDTQVGIAKSIGLGLIGFCEAFESLRPDIVVVLGDRFEVLAAVTAATVACIPVAHLHGGESTEGAFDEAMRHSITKMSHLHFVAAEEYRRRVIQLGEQPERVFLVGGLGIDSIQRLGLLSREALEAALGHTLGERSLLVTFHPVTLERSTAEAQMKQLLGSLAELVHTQLIFTMPNADRDGRVLFELINQFVAVHANSCVHTSLGQLRYISCIAHVDGVVGNSSSGLTEVPSLQKGTVNIGDRQRGRLKAKSVIDCEPKKAAISAAIARLYQQEFRESLRTVRNPYGEGGASEKIVEVIRTYPLDGILKKSFYDIPNCEPEASS